MKKWIRLAATALVLFTMTACSFSDTTSPTEENKTKETPSKTKEAEEETSSLSTWTVYWDSKSGDSEISKAKDLDSLCIFGVYYNEEQGFIIPDTVKSKPKFKGKKYLSFINDMVRTDGSSSQKDADLLHQLIGTADKRKQHIDKIISLTKENKFDGIEIDYEAMGDDSGLWEEYTEFLSLLYSRTKEEKLELRAVLEPLAPFEDIELPDGPEYVIMCYNLHGGFSEPGAKADVAFIQEIAQTTKHITNRCFAFATGGFDWFGSSCDEVTEAQAKELSSKYKAEEKREDASGAVYFEYTDGQGETHTIYYADGETLSLWKKTADAEGIKDFALWRLGGNRIKSVKEFFKKED